MADKNYTLWRYLNFPKYMSLLEEESLYFTRADKFEDPLEGRYPSKVDPNGQYIRFKTKGTLTNSGKPIDINVVGGQPVRIAADTIRHKIVINCWQINEHESDAMWKIYLDSVEGVAIQSNIQRLEESIKEPWNKYQIIRPVKYLDYAKTDPPSTNALDPFFCKRKAFEHENELRAMITLFNEKSFIVDHGLKVPVDLDVLIEMIHISPKAPIWFSQLVQKLLIRYGLKVQIKHSNLYNKA